MNIVVKKDLKETKFNQLTRGTVFRIPDDSETFYVKIRFEYNHSNNKYETIWGAINLYDGSFHSFCSEDKVISYEDAELVIK